MTVWSCNSYNPAGVLRNTVLLGMLPNRLGIIHMNILYFSFTQYLLKFKYEIHFEGFSDKVLKRLRLFQLRIPV